MSDRVAQFLRAADDTSWTAGEAPDLASVQRRGAAIRRRRRVYVVASGLATALVAGAFTAVLSGGPRQEVLPDRPVPARTDTSRAPTAAPGPSTSDAPSPGDTLPRPGSDASGAPAEGFPPAADFGPDWVVGTVANDNGLTAVTTEVAAPTCPGAVMTPIRAPERHQNYRVEGSQTYAPGRPGTQWLLDVRVADLSAAQLAEVTRLFDKARTCESAELYGDVTVAATPTLLVAAKPNGHGYTYAKGWGLAGTRLVFLDLVPDMIQPAEVPPQWMVEATRTVAFRASGVMPPAVTATTPAVVPSPSAPPTGNSTQVHTPTPAPPGFLSADDLNVAGVTGWEVGNVVSDYYDSASHQQLDGCAGSSPLAFDGRTRLQAYRSSLGEDPAGPYGELFGTETVIDLTAAQEKAVRAALTALAPCRTVLDGWVVDRLDTAAGAPRALVGTSVVGHRLVIFDVTAISDGGTAVLPGGLAWFRAVVDAVPERLKALPA